MSITYSEYVFVAVGNYHATHLYPIILLSVACPALQYLSTLSHKRTIFGKKVLEQKMCFNFLYKFVSNISHSKKN